MTQAIRRLAAFCDGQVGGNPAGVAIVATLPDSAQMQQIAAELGYSETVFAAPQPDKRWRVRYFSPQSEVPFCGHATIALGAALACDHGDGVFDLTLNQARISVAGRRVHDGKPVSWSAALQSPPTSSYAPAPELAESIMALFSLRAECLDPALPMAFAQAGANHVIVGLNSRQTLANMAYDQAAGKRLMDAAGLITVMLVYSESASLFHARNPFASGGVYEDPATGAACAALAGYLRDINWPHAGSIAVIQGEDMGCRSLLRADIPHQPGSSIRVSGDVRIL